MNSSPHADTKTKTRRIYTQILTEYGFDLQVLRGAARFRETRPGWLLIRGRSDWIDKMDLAQMDGAIGHFTRPETEIDPLRAAGVRALVGFSNRTPGLTIPRRINDDIAVGRTAAEYFLRKRFRKFAVVGISDCLFSQERVAGFRERLADEGIVAVPEFRESEYLSLARNTDSHPLALFVVADRPAQTVMNDLLLAEVRVPEEVAVMGVDDDEVMAPFTVMPLSSVQVAGEAIGFACCECLEGMMRGEDPDPMVQRFAPPGVVERRSTETGAVEDPLVRRALAYMEQHLVDLPDVAALAEGVHVHRRTLDRAFLAATGKTPFDWLVARRVRLAEQLLRQTDYTMDVIAERAGFGAYERMLRAFKRMNRPTPSQSRRKNA